MVSAIAKETTCLTNIYIYIYIDTDIDIDIYTYISYNSLYGIVI